ncbi:hypothetical protein [Streptomyces sp. NBC_01794]|uniref:hypothetical protein n=1 Tax=Streptomyces sp. NBC_01794 TaxID=2975942 RepID=UPI003088ED62|nr:hypothetical protein OIE54_04630 [Streptomyces sp. NBC_01794]
MPALGVDDLRKLSEIDGRLVDVGRADPGVVPQTDVSVVRQEPDHTATAVTGIAEVAAGLRRVAETSPSPVAGSRSSGKAPAKA